MILLAACASPAQQTTEIPTQVITDTPTPAPTDTPLPSETPTPEPTATPESISTTSYKIEEGDTFESIANNNKITMESLMLVNPLSERIKWYAPITGNPLVGFQINIPLQNSETILNVDYQELFDRSLQLENYIKITDPERRFVFYKNNETGQVDRVYDREVGEIMGYSVSKDGIVLLTSPGILENRSLLVATYQGGNIDNAINAWKKHHINHGNPLLLTENTKIELEFRASEPEIENDPLQRPRDWLRAGDVWLMWTSTGALRIVMFNDLMAKSKSEIGVYADYAAGSMLSQALRFTIPEKLGSNRPGIPNEWIRLTRSSDPEFDIIVAGWGKVSLSETDNPRPIQYIGN